MKEQIVIIIENCPMIRFNCDDFYVRHDENFLKVFKSSGIFEKPTDQIALVVPISRLVYCRIVEVIDDD